MQNPRHLSQRVHRELSNAANELWLSPVSTWEALALHRKGKIVLGGDLADWVRQATAPFLEAPLTHEIATASSALAFEHSDPADRFIAATALVLDLTLVSADRRLLGLGSIATLANQ
ncbi:MAG: type II toxin-antitoxin system VapC family toxin [Acidobacteriales bacterium]|nr:type II toxin-antitoxin system VapC family toxin [Terriglobales bacterium]